jgi:hypothetical protein
MVTTFGIIVVNEQNQSFKASSWISQKHVRSFVPSPSTKIIHSLRQRQCTLSSSNYCCLQVDDSLLFCSKLLYLYSSYGPSHWLWLVLPSTCLLYCLPGYKCHFLLGSFIPFTDAPFLYLNELMIPAQLITILSF